MAKNVKLTPGSWVIAEDDLSALMIEPEPKPENKTATEVMMKREAAWRRMSELVNEAPWRQHSAMNRGESQPWFSGIDPVESPPNQWPPAGSVEIPAWMLGAPAKNRGFDLGDEKLHNPLAAMCDYRDSHSTERLPVSTAKPAIVGILTQRAVTHRLGLGVSYE